MGKLLQGYKRTKPEAVIIFPQGEGQPSKTKNDNINDDEGLKVGRVTDQPASEIGQAERQSEPYAKDCQAVDQR